ncbi:MAG: ATP-binding protein [Actinomycetota bacterium]|nr:ATP-binding protein [Actinomycetota bacterium]
MSSAWSFVGRNHELDQLDREFAKIDERGRGRLLLLRGRRQVGKSTLLSEWVRRRGVPAALFTASRRSPEREVELFTREIADSALPSAPAFAAARPRDWDDALSLLASTHPPTVPAVVVIDEFPYLVRDDPSVESTIQKLWDRRLINLPLLLILVGSDLALMAALTSYDRPLYGRPNRELAVDPLAPGDVGNLLGLDPADAIDAYLVVGGLPGVVTSWGRGARLQPFVESELSTSTSPLVVMGERSLNAEFPPDAHARRVLDSVGSGQRTFRSIGDRAAISDATLSGALPLLMAKGVVAVDEPLSARQTRKLRRYRVADPYLRFWLRFIGPQLPELEGGRAHVAISRLWAGWPSYRGVAVEPVVRAAIQRLLPDTRFGPADRVGSWWTRSNDEEVDLVGMAEGRVAFAGSIKWRDRLPFDDRDRAQLVQAAARIPGADPDTLLVGVSRAGFTTDELDVALGASDLIGG